MNAFITLIIFATLLIHSAHFKKLKYEFVTCGSSLKLLNANHNVRLHSHEVRYNSGSGQQSVTGVDSSDDKNSYWIVRERSVSKVQCQRGRPIKCGQTVRFTHVATRKNLHSHHFEAPLSTHLEVSAFGDERGDGDSGDDWQIECTEEAAQFWKREEYVRLKNVVTGHYLFVSGQKFGRPITGQSEIVCAPSDVSSSTSSQWMAAEGVFIKQNTESTWSAAAGAKKSENGGESDAAEGESSHTEL